jgi:hypothetical protein
VRLGVLTEGIAPSRATWLPVRKPPPRPEPEPLPSTPPTATSTAASTFPPVPGLPAMPTAPPTAPSAPAAPSRRADLPPPGWHPDPSGRHWWRWWDGGDWTDHVADGGAPYTDPLPPR